MRTFVPRDYTSVGPPVAVAALLLLCVGCATRVRVPDAAHDHAPVVTVNGLPTGSGTVDPVGATDTMFVAVSKGTKFAITGVATNPGGVRDLALKVSVNTNVMFDIFYTDLLSLVTAPDSISITGTDGHGHVGNTPLLFQMDDSGDVGIRVDATASNYNNQIRSITVIYYCGDCNPVTGPTGNGPSPTGAIDECPTGTCFHGQVCCKGSKGSVCIGPTQTCSVQ